MKGYGRILTVFLAAIAVFSAGCSRGETNAQNREFENALQNIKAVYAEVFKILVDNRANLDKGIVDAEKYIDANRQKLKADMETLQKDLNLERQSLLREFNKDVIEMSMKPGKELEPYIDKVTKGKERVLKILESVQSYHKMQAEK